VTASSHLMASPASDGVIFESSGGVWVVRGYSDRGGKGCELFCIESRGVDLASGPGWQEARDEKERVLDVKSAYVHQRYSP
jgi:hypothetical protein